MGGSLVRHWDSAVALAMGALGAAILIWLAFSPPLITVRWQTASETDTIAFNLLRTSGDAPAVVIVNATPIPARGSPTQGAAYTYHDRSVQRGQRYTYHLQELTAQGETITYPWQVTAQARSPRWQWITAAALLFGGGGWALRLSTLRGRTPTAIAPPHP